MIKAKRNSNFSKTKTENSNFIDRYGDNYYLWYRPFNNELSLLNFSCQRNFFFFHRVLCVIKLIEKKPI